MLEDWLQEAKEDCENTLIARNYEFELEHSCLDLDLLKEFKLALESFHRKQKAGTYRAILEQFVRDNKKVPLSGAAVEFPPNGVTSIVNAWKIRELFDVEIDIGEVDYKAKDSIIQSTVKSAERELQRELNTIAATTGSDGEKNVGSSSSTGSRRKSNRSQRTQGDHWRKTFDSSSVIWVTKTEHVWEQTSGRKKGADLALLLRRLLGLPTCYREAEDGEEENSTEQFFRNLFFRIRFMPRESDEDTASKNSILRKPTVFSGGYADVYGTYWGSPPGDGWGRTITLCARDEYDGSVGLPEAVVSLKDLIATFVIQVGHVGPGDIEFARDEQINVKIFEKRRFSETLGEVPG